MHNAALIGALLRQRLVLINANVLAAIEDLRFGNGQQRVLDRHLPFLHGDQGRVLFLNLHIEGGPANRNYRGRGCDPVVIRPPATEFLDVNFDAA
jgi:hypothetical protein